MSLAIYASLQGVSGNNAACGSISTGMQRTIKRANMWANKNGVEERTALRILMRPATSWTDNFGCAEARRRTMHWPTHYDADWWKIVREWYVEEEARAGAEGQVGEKRTLRNNRNRRWLCSTHRTVRWNER